MFLKDIITALCKDFYEIMKQYNYFEVYESRDEIILEHGSNLSKIVIKSSDNDCNITVNFKNHLDEEYFKLDWSLGDNKQMCFEDIFTIIQKPEFKDFCIRQKPQNNIEDIIGTVKNPLQTNDLSYTQSRIDEICKEISELLIYKNKKYGNSALEPKRIFYKGSAETSILIRLDDKLGRIINNDGQLRINDVCDIIGYLILYLVLKDIDLEEIRKLKD